MNHREANSAKAVRDIANEETEKRNRKNMVENSAIETSTTLKLTNLSVQELNIKQATQADHLFNLLKLQKNEQEAQGKLAKESRFISWMALVISMTGMIFTIISYFHLVRN
jgi:hypothetical protein